MKLPGPLRKLRWIGDAIIAFAILAFLVWLLP